MPQCSPGQTLLSKRPELSKRCSEGDVHRKEGDFIQTLFPWLPFLPCLPALPIYRPYSWCRGMRARLLEAVELRKMRRSPLRFPSKMLLKGEKHWSGCCCRSSASPAHRVLPWEPFSSQSSQEPSHSKWKTSHGTFPIAVLLYPLCHWQGSFTGGDSRWDLEGGKCISQLYYLPFGFPFGVPNTARDGCCEKKLLPCAPRRNHWGPCGGAPCWDRQKDRVFSLGVHSNQDTLIISSTGSPFQLSLQ